MELLYLFGILAVLGIIGIIYAAVEFHRQSHRPTKKREEIQMYLLNTFVSVILGYLGLSPIMSGYLSVIF